MLKFIFIKLFTVKIHKGLIKTNKEVLIQKINERRLNEKNIMCGRFFI